MILLMMLLMMNHYADQVLTVMLITMLKMNDDDDGPDIEHLVICHHGDNHVCFATAKCLILSLGPSNRLR
jgi:hypothetical protein